MKEQKTERPKLGMNSGSHQVPWGGARRGIASKGKGETRIQNASPHAITCRTTTSPGAGRRTVEHAQQTHDLPLAAAALAVAAVLVFVVTKEPHYNVRPGAQSGNAHCGRIAENAPAKLAGHTQHATKLAGVALWGDSNIVLRCGVTDIGPLSDPCFSADGVDWVIDTSRSTDTQKVIITYGRTPATEVTVTHSPKAPDEILVELSSLIAPITQTSECIRSE